jgi:hypothetical protein
MAFSTSQAIAVGPVRFMPLGAIKDDVVRGFMMTSRAVVMWFGVVAIAVLAFVFGYSETREHVISAVTDAATQAVVSAWTAVHGTAHAATEVVVPTVVAVVETPAPQKRVTEYLSRRYRVADGAIKRVVAVAFDAAKEAQIDPLLVLAVTAVESSMNPFAQSSVGAQGLMQVHTRVHTDKFDAHGGEEAALDPMANIRVGTLILAELVRRGGSVERGLQLYVGAGNLPDDGGYGARVLAEHGRLKMAAGGRVDAALAAGQQRATTAPATAVKVTAPAARPPSGAAAAEASAAAGASAL